MVEDSKAYIRPVTTGIVDSDRVAITDGLQPGDRVVLEGLDRLRDGREVIVEGDAPVVKAERPKTDAQGQRAAGMREGGSREGAAMRDGKGKGENSAGGQRSNRNGAVATPSPSNN